jgi:hypothetical protein
MGKQKPPGLLDEMRPDPVGELGDLVLIVLEFGDALDVEPFEYRGEGVLGIPVRAATAGDEHDVPPLRAEQRMVWLLAAETFVPMEHEQEHRQDRRQRILTHREIGLEAGVVAHHFASIGRRSHHWTPGSGTEV